MSLVTQAPVIDIALPLIKNGKVRYLLKLALTPEHFRVILAGQRLDPQWTLTILDRRGVVVARSRDHEHLVGNRSGERARDAKDVCLEKSGAQAIVAALAMVPSANWQVRVSAPVDVARAPATHSTMLLTAAALLAGLLTLGLGTYFASRISHPLREIASVAQGLGRDASLLLPGASYKEANLVNDALETAAAELRKLRERERLVVSESSHRVKNLLAVVQSIVHQTLREGCPIMEARSTLSGRLAALGRSQDALTSAGRDAVLLDQIIAPELVPYGDRITVEGPAIRVSGAFAQTVSLLVHELATNAAKYGALSNDAGRVSMSWSVQGTGDTARLCLCREERHGPAVPGTPIAKGFGSALLEAALPGASPQLSCDREGITYAVEVPLTAICAT
jgi:two-component sensor histidine kinase